MPPSLFSSYFIFPSLRLCLSDSFLQFHIYGAPGWLSRSVSALGSGSDPGGPGIEPHIRLLCCEPASSSPTPPACVPSLASCLSLSLSLSLSEIKPIIASVIGSVLSAFGKTQVYGCTFSTASFMKSNTVPACLTEIKQFRIKYIDGTRGYYAKETSRQRKTIIVRSH